MKMDSSKMKKELENRLKSPNRSFSYDREKDELKIVNVRTGKGITIAISGIVAKWHEQKDKVIDEVVYYVEEGLKVMGTENSLLGNDKKIFPVIRSTSFPVESGEGEKFITEEHTAETRIYYALDLGQSYRLIDEKMVVKEGVDPKQIKESALFNLRSLSTEVKKDEVAGNSFYFLSSKDGYDASRILNDSFLKQMRNQINGNMVLAVPHQDVLIIADIQNNTGYDVLAQMAMSFFASGKVPITALSFAYEEGELEPMFILGKNRKM
ncbi:DUF1444 domain-containing protein [Bacillus sp. CGMCC 1.16607]|uniref:DUF1444 domain-containing protein n=1 Tax=Bacillus sp. CGMCC 1.16607 TaxID=3351842 RepID=UPI0036434D9E